MTFATVPAPQGASADVIVGRDDLGAPKIFEPATECRQIGTDYCFAPSTIIALRRTFAHEDRLAAGEIAKRGRALEPPLGHVFSHRFSA